MKLIQRAMTRGSSYAIVGALCAIAGLAAAQIRDQMVVRPFEQVKFSPQDPKRPEGAQVAVLSGSPSGGPVAVLLKFKKGDIPMHSHTFAYHAVMLQGRAKHWAQGEDANAAPALGPGSYWYQPGKLVHTDACLEESSECMIFAYSLGKQDFVPAGSR